MISRDRGDSWERLDIELPADRVLVGGFAE